jgi:hypothetical protein
MLHAIMLLDESGSMSPVKEDVIGGYKEYLKTLRDKGGDVRLSLFTFDLGGIYMDGDTSILHEKFVDTSLDKLPKMGPNWFHPRGSTPLNDAVLLCIKRMKKVVRKGDDVLFIIYTDGHENASCSGSEEVKTKIQKMENRGWDFVYLGANQDAWSVGNGIGVSGLKLNTTDTNIGTRALFASTANITGTAMRASGQGVYSVGEGGTLASAYEGKDIGEKPIKEDEPEDAA